VAVAEVATQLVCLHLQQSGGEGEHACCAWWVVVCRLTLLYRLHVLVCRGAASWAQALRVLGCCKR
jgi:hypothetical protein